MSSDETRSVVEHNAAAAKRDQQWSQETTVRETIRKCARAKAHGETRHFRYIAAKLRDVLLPAVVGDGHPADFEAEVAGHEAADYGHFKRFVAAPDRWIEQLADQTTGPQAEARAVVLGAFGAVVAIAEANEVISDELQSRADATGFTLKLGEHQRGFGALADLGDPVSLVTEEAGTLKTLVFGGTGMSKSTVLEREAEDFYQQNFREGRDYKLIDLIDLRDGENWFYDIPQQQNVLRRTREEFDLAPDFTEAEALEAPQVEILAPLSPGLTDRRLPYDTDDESFTVQPFTIPASALREELLIPLLMARVSDQEQNTLRQAYKDVDNRDDDWTLSDLAAAIQKRDELAPKHKENAIGVLRGLQQQGFIRTEQCEYTLDWDRLFRDTETITLFTQALVEDNIGKYIALAYLVDAILEERKQRWGMADAVLIMREFWKVAPHRNRRKSDPQLANIQEAIGDRLTEYFRENRHYGVHLLADTQWPSDLLKSVRQNFNRYIVGNGTKDIIQDVFEWTTNDHWRSFYSTMTEGRGTAGVVGKLQPAIDNRRIEYISPVHYAPPSHHHKARRKDDNGWRARCGYLGGADDVEVGRNEELRRPRDVTGVRWPDEVPDRLRIADVTPSTDDDPNADMSPVAAFVADCLTEAGDYLLKADAYAAFNAYMEAQGREPWDFEDSGTQVRFGTRVKKHADWGLTAREKSKGMAFDFTKLTDYGRQLIGGVGDTEAATAADDPIESD